MQISGVLRVGEAAAYGGKVARRNLGASRLLLLVMPAVFAAVFATVLGGAYWAACKAFGVTDDWLALVVGLSWALGAVVWLRVWRRIAVKRFQKKFIKADIPIDLPMSVSIEPGALHYRLGEIESRIGWGVVTELFEVDKYWVFLAQGGAYWAPRRFFTDAESERAFVAEALAHMGQAARARSIKAAAFLRAKAA